jgi:endoglucanase
LLLAAHMDAIGLMVRSIVDGFLRVTGVGGLDPRVLPGQMVTVHGKKDLPGVIVQPPAFLLPPSVAEGAVPLEYLLVDTGCLAQEVKELVRVGDLVSFAQAPLELGSDVLAGHSLDNRASVAAVTACLQILQGRQTQWDVWAAATVQEEVGVKGALTSAFSLNPTLAVAIDVTFASGPGSPETQTFPFGKGVTLGWGPNIHPALFQAFKELADRLEIPYKLEVMPGHSGTDAYGLQVAREGIPTMVLSIPLRYMHTPVEVISIKDIERAGRLMAEFATSLSPDFVEKITWDD